MRGGDWEVEAAYFAFISLGIFPDDFRKRSENERILMFAMMERAAKEKKVN